ncbi:PadR family transcriptional regulator [Agrobacterium vitis]|uniref:PadR family transcriptional regulator n=1 Tax=Agrobacterium vitis TaxID=373 RepID=A0A368NSI7_AGRVI|nr:PadR family transcriptional regulator [Agrobacterium vitis]KAA3519598.1 PadR family transcriptional regulator [Agrobacterium vitis]KAA3532191.1 PadR family transcriptional regulator [Agrobacterium vitis]MCF1475736.1 PadR family transcriptional regulator [Agrobacterium vitis]MUZ95031.1 PadR family transcriptional regulator [Agrobacterium vitis]MVA29498.1 PadR family transcriptional regulator [Agrobacterium vitis]
MRFSHSHDYQGEHGGRGGGRGGHPLADLMHAMRGGPFGHKGPDGKHGRGRDGERRRMFETGELRLVLLKLISELPRHGYDLIREIERLSGGAYAPSPGVIYPTMTLLLDMGLAEEQQTEGARKLLGITEAGKIHLDDNAEAVEIAIARLTALAKLTERTDAGPVRRAIHNLRAVIHDRLAQDDVSRETQLDVARILDEAASKIERL